jgi:hypothetical protein
MWSQSIQITVQPGQQVRYIRNVFGKSLTVVDVGQGALIANVQYKRTSGNIQIGNG